MKTLVAFKMVLISYCGLLSFKQRYMHLLLIIGFFSFTFPLKAEIDQLKSALILAYKNSPRLLAARAQLRSADEQVPQALSNWKPEISLSGDLGYSDVTTEQLIRMQRIGVTPELIQSLQEEQGEDIPLEDIIRYRISNQ